MKAVDIHQDLIMTYGNEPVLFFDSEKGKEISPDYNVGTYDDYKDDYALVVNAIRPYVCEGDMKDVHGRKISFDENLIEKGIDGALSWGSKLSVVKSSDDLTKEGLKVLIHIEGHDNIDSVDIVKNWYEKGVRSFGRTWNNDTTLSGAHGSAEKGLTPLGFELMEAMNSWGMIIDTAHMSRQGMKELLQSSTKPILNSHSNIHAIHAHSRNIPDEIIDLFPKNGGVIGLSLYKPFISTDPIVTIDQYVEQVGYIVNRIGDDYVALGSDWHGIPKEKTVAGMESVKGIHLLYERMNAKLGSITTEKFFHENAMRVIKANLG